MKLAFNERETLFRCEQTLYTELEDLIKDFEPFFELTQMAHAVKCSLSDWNNEPLAKQDPEAMELSVSNWLESCDKVHEEFKEQYPEAALAA